VKQQKSTIIHTTKLNSQLLN